MDVLQRLQDILKERGWSVYRLAKESEINPSTLGNLFARNNVPTIPTLERICQALGMTLAEFFTEESPASPDERLNTNMEAKWKTLSTTQKQLLLALMEQFSS